MQLGDFLKDAPEAPVEPVTFRILHKSDRGAQTTVEVRAVLAFVDAYETTEARREAKRASALATKDGAAPPLDFEDEVFYHLLLRALRDPDDPRRAFVAGINPLAQLKKAVTPNVAGALVRAYNAFVEREFPTTVSDREREALRAEAEKNS